MGGWCEGEEYCRILPAQMRVSSSRLLSRPQHHSPATNPTPHHYYQLSSITTPPTPLTRHHPHERGGRRPPPVPGPERRLQPGQQHQHGIQTRVDGRPGWSDAWEGAPVSVSDTDWGGPCVPKSPTPPPPPLCASPDPFSVLPELLEIAPALITPCFAPSAPPSCFADSSPSVTPTVASPSPPNWATASASFVSRLGCRVRFLRKNSPPVTDCTVLLPRPLLRWPTALASSAT